MCRSTGGKIKLNFFRWVITESSHVRQRMILYDNIKIFLRKISFSGIELGWNDLESCLVVNFTIIMVTLELQDLSQGKLIQFIRELHRITTQL